MTRRNSTAFLAFGQVVPRRRLDPGRLGSCAPAGSEGPTGRRGPRLMLWATDGCCSGRLHVRRHCDFKPSTPWRVRLPPMRQRHHLKRSRTGPRPTSCAISAGPAGTSSSAIWRRSRFPPVRVVRTSRNASGIETCERTRSAAEVTIEGSADDELAARFAIFHLLSPAPNGARRRSAPAA